VIVVVMGVAGCGKTTVGRALAQELGWTFVEADDLHPRANVAKMASGIALTDEDRWPWYDRIVAELRRRAGRGEHVVLACSALRRAYRERLARAGALRFVYLKADAVTIAARLGARQGHFMPASLLASQLATLEEPADAIVSDAAQNVAAQVAAIARALREAAEA
jgi:gluconokinase